MYKPLDLKSFTRWKFPFVSSIRTTGELGIVHSIFASVYSLTGVSLLVFGIAVWVLCPIMGLLLLLLYGQSFLSQRIFKGKKAKVDLPLVILIIFTTTLYCTSISHYYDVAVNMDWFNQILARSKFEAVENVEAGAFILPYYLSFGEAKSGIWFLFIQSLTINTLFTLYSFLLLPEIAPLITLVNITGGVYLSHLMALRQAYSLIFIIPALQTSKFWLATIFLFLAFQTHSSSAIFIPFVLLSHTVGRNPNYFYRILKKGKFVAIFALLVAFLIITMSLSFFSEKLINLGAEEYSYAISYAGSLGGGKRLNSYISILLVIPLLWLTVQKILDRSRPISYFSWFISFFFLCASILYTFLTEASVIPGYLAVGIRISMYFRFLPGLFMYSFFMSGLLRSGVKRLMPAYVLLFYILLQTSNFIYAMLRTQQIGESAVGRAYFVFWNGYPLSANLYDYFILAKEALSS